MREGKRKLSRLESLGGVELYPYLFEIWGRDQPLRMLRRHLLAAGVDKNTHAARSAINLPVLCTLDIPSELRAIGSHFVATKCTIVCHLV
jgi:hypothetical protein